MNKRTYGWIGLVGVVIVTGCATGGFPDLQRYINMVKSEYATIEGTVEGYSSKPQSIVVALWDADKPDRGVMRFWFARGRGQFRFVVNAPGRYSIMAFEDLNGDLAFQQNEPAGICKDPSLIMALPDETITGLVVKIEAPQAIQIGLRIDIDPYTSVGTDSELRYYQVGQVTSLENPRFSATNSQLGLWMPIEFVREMGMGLFFLDPFLKDKIPLLFIHGSGGNPTDFRFLIDRIDRSRYLPWVYFYPTGMSLERQSELLYKIIMILQNQLGFKQLCLFSHSMGGLVGRGMIAEAVRNSAPIEFPTFITLSTPWQGHSGVEKGMVHSPVVVPAWRDLAPSSRFLQKIWETPLPPKTSYYLLFGYSGKFSLMINRNNDSVVSLASELDPRAQAAARKMYGFNEDHSGILASPPVSQVVNTILSNRDVLQPWVERKVE
jgi:pimeloyl-ACP methyl ester carboxylesterase